MAHTAGRTETAQTIERFLREAASAHGVYEATVLNGVHHEEWPEWYAEHMAQSLESAQITIVFGDREPGWNDEAVASDEEARHE